MCRRDFVLIYVSGILRANPSISLPRKIQAPDVLALRSERLERVRKLQQLPRAPNCKPLSDCIDENMKSADADLAHPVNVFIVVAQECRRGLIELLHTRRIVASRCARLPHQQLSDEVLQLQLREFSERCSTEATVFEQCASTIDNFLSHHKLPTTVSAAALPPTLPACPIHLQHVAAVIRSLVPPPLPSFTIRPLKSNFSY
jgi:hypothetical protein